MKKSNLIDLAIFLLLLILWFPLAIIFVTYKLYVSRQQRNVIQTKKQKTDISKKTEKFLTPVSKKNNIISSFAIPEPTKSLLWVTDEDVSKISSPLQIKIEINIDKNGIKSNTVDDSYNFFSEPSLIWTRLPVQPNEELEYLKMYYPTYHGLSPRNRFQYLRWLADITKDTNLSYVFLYYYGLERHLLIGNYDLAVDEILKLIEYHDKGTFRSYAINALILASGYRKRADIIEKAPFILEGPSPISIYLQMLAKKPLSARNVIYLASRVGFTNRRYINLFPELFERELQKVLDEYESKHGDILQKVNVDTLPKTAWASIANISVPEDIRTVKFPSILDSNLLKSVLKERLEETHQLIKAQKLTSKKDNSHNKAIRTNV